MAHDVFISYASQDKLVADAVYTILEQEGIKCWIAPRDIAITKKYSGEITRAIKNSKVFLLIYSQNSNNSDYVLSEIENAFGQIPIAALRIKDVPYNDDLNLYLNHIQWCDALTRTCEACIIKMAEKLKVILKEEGKKDFNKIESETKIHPEIKEDCCIRTTPSKACIYCGKSNPEDYDFCSSCGKPTDYKAVKNKKTKKCPNPNCGNKKNPSEATFCFKCGYSLNPNPNQNKLIKKIKDNKNIIIVSLIALILIGSVFFVLGMAPKEVTISSPVNGSMVSSIGTVTGSTKNLNSNDKVYLLIQPQSYANETGFGWYVFQTNLNTDGTWN